MSSYKIIIPSFARSEIIKTHTLRCLLASDVVGKFHVFVANRKEKEEYEKSLKSYERVEIIVGVRGIPNQRNFIQRYFPEKEHLLFIDDDIEKIIGLDRSGKRVQATKLHNFIESAFQTTDRLGLKMFGINSTDSNLEMKQAASVGLIYLVGNFYGLINQHVLFVDEGKWIKARAEFKAGKESHERALQMYERYGGVIKYRNFGVVSKYWKTSGGHQVSRTLEGEKEASEKLHKAYPHLTSLRNYNGYPDLIIKHSTSLLACNFFQ